MEVYAKGIGLPQLLSNPLNIMKFTFMILLHTKTQ